MRKWQEVEEPYLQSESKRTVAWSLPNSGSSAMVSTTGE